MKKVGLALGSGGARGLAHLGVIKSLVNNNIPIDYIAGSSIGALIGGLFAYFNDVNKIEELINGFSRRDFLSIFSDIDFKVKGLIKGNKAIEFLRSKIGSIKIEEFKIPFKAVATDINTGEVVFYEKGDFLEAVRASGSVPGIFRPYFYRGRYLVDGGVSMPVPVKAVKEMGAEFIIAVSLESVFIFDKETQKDIPRINAYTVVLKSLDMMRYHLAQENLKGADIIIEPKIKNGSWLSFISEQKKEIIKIGEKECLKFIPLIKKKLVC